MSGEARETLLHQLHANGYAVTEVPDDGQQHTYYTRGPAGTKPCPACNPGGVFRIRASGRVFWIITAYRRGVFIANCRDGRTGYESQAVVDGVTAADPKRMLADPQVRDAIRSAYYNATAHESGRYPDGGTSLPDGYIIERIAEG